MVNFQAGQLAKSWDICLKVPVIVRNALPFDLALRTLEIADYTKVRRGNEEIK